MSTSKFTEKLTTLRAINHELTKALGKRKDGQRDPSIEHILSLFRANQVTEKKFCRPEDHYRYFADTYLTYLRSTRLQDEITRKYFLRGDRSVKESANLVGLDLPKQAP